MKRLLLVAAIVALAVPAAAQWRYVKTAAEVTVSNTAIALFTAADVQAGSGHPQATVGVCSLSGANIRLSYSGTDPTTNLGEILTPGNYTILGVDVMLNAKGIRDDSTDATWNCVIQGN